MRKSKHLLLSIILIFIFFLNCKATSKDSTLSRRNLNQQMFLIEYVKQNEPVSGFESETEFLDFMKDASKKWANLVPNQSEIYKTLDTYAVMWATYTLFKNELPQNYKCLAYSKIALPSFIKNVEYLKEKLLSKDPTIIDAANLIRMSNMLWAANQPPTFNCDLNQEQWENLKNIIFEYPDIIQEFMNFDLVKKSLTGSQYNTLRRVSSSAKSILPIFELQDKIYKNKLDELYIELESRFTNAGDNMGMYILISKKLFEKHLNNNQIDKAYATLDLLATNTSNSSLSRLELEGLYEKAGKQKGLERYRNIELKENKLVLSNSQIELDLYLFDATNNENYSNTKLNNQLIILDFWSVGCGPCIKKIPNLNLIYEKHKDDVTLISINSDFKLKLEVLQKFIKDKGINYPVLVDSKEANLMRKFSVSSWPTYFLINSNGYFYKEPIENRIKLTLDEVEEFLNK